MANVRLPLLVVVIALGLSGCGDSKKPRATSTAATTATIPTTAKPALNAADFLGASLVSATSGGAGVTVRAVQPGTRSRLKPGDIILAVNGVRIHTIAELGRVTGPLKVGQSFTLRVARGRDRFTLTERPAPIAFLGADVRTNRGGTGAAVAGVATQSPAAAAGIRHGDVITALDGRPVRSGDDLVRLVGAHLPGDLVRVSLVRARRQLDVQATLARRPG